MSYSETRNLEKNLLARLSALDFIAKKENLIITGPCGVGKSYLALALLDRIVNAYHRINLKGESLRKGMVKEA